MRTTSISRPLDTHAALIIGIGLATTGFAGPHVTAHADGPACHADVDGDEDVVLDFDQQ